MKDSKHKINISAVRESNTSLSDRSQKETFPYSQKGTLDKSGGGGRKGQQQQHNVTKGKKWNKFRDGKAQRKLNSDAIDKSFKSMKSLYIIY